MSSLKISEELEGRLVVVEIDHGKANEMGRAQLDEFDALGERLRGGPAVALLSYSRRVTEKGTALFVSGANVTERVGWDNERIKAHVDFQRDVLMRLRHAPVFHVAVCDGLAWGWGCEYLLTADYVIAGPRATFALPETGLGIVPGAGGTGILWQKIGITQALRLGMTGEVIDPGEALRIGLVDELCASVDAGVERGRSLAGRASTRSPTAIAAFKGAVLATAGHAVEAERRAYHHAVDSGEAAIGRAHFDEIRKGAKVPWGPRSLL